MRRAEWLLLVCVACGTTRSQHPDAAAARDAASADGHADTSDARDGDAGGKSGTSDATIVGSEPDGASDVIVCSGQGCGIGSPCDGCCVDTICVPKGSLCGEGLGRCLGPSCGSTGGVGQPCASGQGPAGYDVPEDAADDAADPLCALLPFVGCTDIYAACDNDGQCEHCGLVGELCCTNICTGHAYCDGTGRCNAACGGAGQPCCDDIEDDFIGLECDDGGACLDFASDDAPVCVPGAPCNADAGVCTTCGNDGQPCCAGGGCNLYGGNCTDAGTCFATHMK